MADNTTLNAMTGGDTVRTEDISGVKFQVVKIGLGASGVNDGPVSSANPLPVSAASLPLPSGAATSAKQDTLIGHVDGIETLIGTTNSTLSTIDSRVDGLETAVASTNTKLDSILAKQPALGTAGTASADVITVQGKASMTPIQITGVAGAALPVTNDTGDTYFPMLANYIGDTAETAATTDTADAGLNGRLKRISQRLTSIIALLPTALGAGGGLKVDGSGTALPVSGSVTANAGTDLNTSALALESGGNLAAVAAAAGTTSGAAVVTDANGTLQQYLRGIVKLLITSGTIVLGAGTAAIGKLAANSGVDIGDVDVTSLTGSTVAHDAADSGSPHKIGMKAYSPDGTTPGTAVAEGDRTDAKSDLDGRLFVNTDSPLAKHAHLDGSSAYSDQSLVAAPGSGFQIVVKSINFSSGAATAINFFLEEGTTTKIFGPIYLEAVAGRGFTKDCHIPLTANTALTVTSSASIAQSVDIDYIIQAV